MTNLVLSKRDNIEVLINTQTGECYVSAAMYSRISNIAYSTIKSRVQKGDDSITIKSSVIPTGTGFKTGRLIPEDTFSNWIVDDNPQLAKQLLNT